VIVEVLDVGDPPPKLALVTSCPVDFGHRDRLSVGTVVDVELHARRQPWPTPPALRELPDDLPRRWLKSMAAADQLP
jgi:hypothetical protein